MSSSPSRHNPEADQYLTLAIHESEQRYRALFDSMDEGFCVIEVLFDNTGRPCDYRFLETNPAFEKQTGLVSPIGKTVRGLFPNYEEHWCEIYGRIASTGLPERFQNTAAGLGRDYDVFAFRLGPPDLRRVGVLFHDIRERKRVESALRESQARQAFLLQVGDALRPLADPNQIQFEAARLIGEHLGASRAGYGECEDGGSTVVVHRHFTNGVPGIEGRHLLPKYGANLLSDLLSGSRIVVDDIAAEPRFSADEKAAYTGLLIAALAVIPLFKSGRLLALLFVNFREPHSFTPPEVSLLEAVAERTWSAVERARAQSALRESENQFRTLANAIPQLCWTANADGWIVWYNERWYQYTGTTPDQMEGWGWQSVHDPKTLPHVLERWKSSIATGGRSIWSFRCVAQMASTVPSSPASCRYSIRLET